jgi:hypothetical protein
MTTFANLLHRVATYATVALIVAAVIVALFCIGIMIAIVWRGRQ